jgi:hypothetical protein
MCSGLCMKLKLNIVMSIKSYWIPNIWWVSASAKTLLRPDHNKTSSYILFSSTLMCNLIMNTTLTISEFVLWVYFYKHYPRNHRNLKSENQSLSEHGLKYYFPVN